jgi:hypothetical protein
MNIFRLYLIIRIDDILLPDLISVFWNLFTGEYYWFKANVTFQKYEVQKFTNRCQANVCKVNKYL